MFERVGRYIIGERIGDGGMAEVFAGELLGADGFHRPVAIKRLAPERAGRPESVELFVREARLAGRLCHENIAAALDFARDPQGRPYLVMERISGVDLRALMATGPVPLACALAIVGAVLRALAYAHAQVTEEGAEEGDDGEPPGVVHGDVSPHNVMIAWTGAVKLVDFGVARAAGSLCDDAVRGKVSYMSPEQARGIELDGRSDLFSTGVVLYELLTGTRLFAGRPPDVTPDVTPDATPDVRPDATLDLLLRAKIAAPHALDARIPAPLSDTCMRMLARDRAHRFASARAALSALFQSAPEPAGTSDELSALLALRFAERAPSHVGLHIHAPGPLLRAQPVPQVPSVVEAGLDVAAAARARAMLMRTRTRTHPGAKARSEGVSRDPARGDQSGDLRRATAWIVGALALAGVLIALTWWLTR